MRFRGTLVLVVICAALGAYLYFYEIKGGEQREKAKEEQNRLWKLESGNVQQLDLILPEQHITAVRTGEKDWRITAPRPVDADAEELNRLATSAADISRESVIEPNAADLSKFGLNPAQVTVHLKAKDGKEHTIRFGNSNPTGSSTYAALEGSKEVFLVANYVATSFKKSLDDLRNRSVLSFEQFETQSLELQSSKGRVQLAKENDRWWLTGPERLAADSSGVNGILSALSGGRVKEFLEDSPDEYANLGFEAPTVDVRLTVGKDKGIKHLTIGNEKSRLVKKGVKQPATARPPEKKGEGESDTSSANSVLYIARDESRKELFFVEKDLVDKLVKSPPELRDKALAAFQRWDIDGITITNAHGNFSFIKSGGDWVTAASKKKTKWEAVNGILDAIEKPVIEFVDKPGPTSTYGLDNPVTRVILKQGNDVRVECLFGKASKEGVFAQVKGESSVKIADKESLEKVSKNESEFLEPPAPATPAAGSPADAAPKKE
jgi:hypothetical protein